MNIAIYGSDKIISNVIVLDSVPPSTDTESYAECPAWCWIGDSIDKEKPSGWVDPTESTEPTIEQRVSDLEDAVQSIMFTE